MRLKHVVAELERLLADLTRQHYDLQNKVFRMDMKLAPLAADWAHAQKKARIESELEAAGVTLSKTTLALLFPDVYGKKED